MDQEPCECSFCAPNAKSQGRGGYGAGPSAAERGPQRSQRRPRPVLAVCGAGGSRGGSTAPADDASDICLDPPQRRKDIIIRNKKAIKCLSRKTRELKKLKAQQEQMQLSGMFSCYKKKPKPRPKPVRKPSSLVDLFRDKDDCLCELMSKALESNVSRHLALYGQRDAINAGSPDFTTPPASPPPPPPPPKRFYFF